MTDITLKEPSTCDAGIVLRKRLEEELEKKWRTGVAGLPPNDTTGAFLLPEELPDDHSPRLVVKRAIEKASRRALWPDRMVWVQDHALGKINGVMRVMLPQGGDFEHAFHNELGWRATVFVDDGTKQQTFVAYFRLVCMNPIMCAARHGGILDTSSVEFTPVSAKETQRASDAASPLYRATAELARAKRSLSDMRRHVRGDKSDRGVK